MGHEPETALFTRMLGTAPAASSAAATAAQHLAWPDRRPGQKGRAAGRRNFVGERLKPVAAARRQRQIMAMPGENAGEIGADPAEAP